MRTLGLILARAGSKGLPGKNARPVAGRPMLAWTIDHARGSRRLDAVALSTDGAALASIGEAAGVTVLRRGADLSHDTAPVDAAARDALARLGEEFGGPFDAVAILYGNVPVRPADLTDRALAKLADTGCDSVQSVCPVGKAHAYWMKRLGGAGGDALEPYHDSPVYRRQDLPPLYLLDGGALVVTAGSLARVVPGEPHAFLGVDRRAVVTGPGEVVDVDDEADVRLAEAVLRARGAAGEAGGGVGGAGAA